MKKIILIVGFIFTAIIALWVFLFLYSIIWCITYTLFICMVGMYIITVNVLWERQNRRMRKEIIERNKLTNVNKKDL